jgi:2-oxoglutarate ferredoxin oxidoreductase subunit delta
VKGKVKIKSELCKGCTYCVETCPAGVLVMRKKFNKRGYFPVFARRMEKCTGCAMCAVVCPEIAIEVYRDNSKK